MTMIGPHCRTIGSGVQSLSPTCAKGLGDVRETFVSCTASLLASIPIFPCFLPSSTVGKPVPEINVNLLVFGDKLSYDTHTYYLG